jgi:peptidoglycan/LPS O-acetylase OafA/YrhL
MLQTPAIRPAITTTDALKATALLLILVDHVGHFLLPDWPALRAIGRLGAPIFFFLIGFAKTRTIPYRWLVLGIVLTGVDYLWTGTLDQITLNILFNFALIRIVLPFIEARLETGWTWPLGVLALCILALPFAGLVLEYGAEGWLFALAGLAQRRLLDHGAWWKIRRDATALIAFGAYAMMERQDYRFDSLMTALLIVALAMMAAVLHDFRRGDLARQPGPALGALMQFCGRYSLEIYAAQIILLAAAGGLWNLFDPTDTKADDDDA